MKLILFLALGGSLGAICRWSLSLWIDQLRGQSAIFPLGIFVSNFLGCFLFGLLFGLGESRGWMSEHLRMLLFTGFLGSFTTFSTFSWDTMELIRGGQIGLACLNVALSVGVGLLAVSGGYALGRT